MFKWHCSRLDQGVIRQNEQSRDAFLRIEIRLWRSYCLSFTNEQHTRFGLRWNLTTYFDVVATCFEPQSQTLLLYGWYY